MTSITKESRVLAYEHIFDRKEFVSEFKTALSKFFDESFDSEKWR